MRTVIGESSAVLEHSKLIMMNDGLQTTFCDIRAKHASYDSIIEARGAGGKGGKCGSGSGPFERTSYAEGC